MVSHSLLIALGGLGLLILVGLCLKLLGCLMTCKNQWQGEGDIEDQVITENDYPWPLPLIGNLIYCVCIKFPCDTFCNKTVV